MYLTLLRRSQGTAVSLSGWADQAQSPAGVHYMIVFIRRQVLFCGVQALEHHNFLHSAAARSKLLIESPAAIEDALASLLDVGDAKFQVCPQWLSIHFL